MSSINPDALSALTDVANVTATYGSLWLSITFAYLTVAYLIGTKMSRFQYLAVSALYTASAAIFGGAALAHAHAFFLTLEIANTIYDQVWLFSGNSDLWFTCSSFFLIGGTVVALYFMYNVRISESKRDRNGAA
ncbi:MAG: hypothetical protein ACI9BW_003296 [Gammaproteobacteria bacterium]|jgi:hypothetical protein